MLGVKSNVDIDNNNKSPVVSRIYFLCKIWENFSQTYCGSEIEFQGQVWYDIWQENFQKFAVW